MQCPICNYLIGRNNYSRHIKKCDGTYVPNEQKPKYHLDHNDLFCKFCHKECKNLNSLAQHELRCPSNVNRYAYNQLGSYSQNTRKGTTKETNTDVAKQVNTMLNMYANGYVSPNKGRKHDFKYIYNDYNQQQIQKWLDYIETCSVEFYVYDVSTFDFNGKIYKVLKTHSNIYKRYYPFEHNYIADLYLNNKLSNVNTVHHIDRNTLNNDIHNLMVFKTSDDHKRFHNSKYAKLIYDENTHLFECVLDKSI